MASEAAPVCEVDAVAGHRVGGPRLVTEHQRDHNDLARRYLPTTLNYGRRRQVPAGQFRLDGVLLVLQPVHRGVDVIGGRPGDPEVGAHGDIVPPGQGGQLGARLAHAGDDQGQGQVPPAARRAQQRGQAQPRQPGGRRPCMESAVRALLARVSVGHPSTLFMLPHLDMTGR